MNLNQKFICIIISLALSIFSVAHAEGGVVRSVTTKGICNIQWEWGPWNAQWDGYRTWVGTMLLTTVTAGVTTTRSATCAVRQYDMVAPSADIWWITGNSWNASCQQATRTPWAGYTNVVIPTTPHGSQSAVVNSIWSTDLKSCNISYLCSNGSFVGTSNIQNSCSCIGWSSSTPSGECSCPAGTANVGGICTPTAVPPTGSGSNPPPPPLANPTACKARVTNTTPGIFWLPSTVETSVINIGDTIPMKYAMGGFGFWGTTPVNTIECFWPDGVSYWSGQAGNINGAPKCRQSSPYLFSWRLDTIDLCAAVILPPTNCTYVTVNSWSCSATCGGGTQNSTYNITSLASNGGTCPVYQGQVASSQACNTQSCTTRICSSAGECSSKVPANREIDGNPDGYFVRYRGGGQLINVFQSNPVASATQLCQQYGMQYNSHTTLTHGIGCGYAYGLTYYRPEWFWKTDEAPICSLWSVTVIDSITCFGTAIIPVNGACDSSGTSCTSGTLETIPGVYGQLSNPANAWIEFGYGPSTYVCRGSSGGTDQTCIVPAPPCVGSDCYLYGTN